MCLRTQGIDLQRIQWFEISAFPWLSEIISIFLLLMMHFAVLFTVTSVFTSQSSAAGYVAHQWCKAGFLRPLNALC